MAGLTDFLTEGAAIPTGSALTATTSQTVLPDWYTNYAMDLLAGQKALSGQAYTPYQGPRVAGFNPTQQQGFAQTQQAANAYQPSLGLATSATQGLLGARGLQHAQPYFNSAMGYDPIAAASQDYGAARGAIGAAQGINPSATAGSYYNQALGMDPMAAAQGNFAGAESALGRAQGVNATGAAQPYFNQALGMNPLAAADPSYNQATSMSGLGAAQPYYGGALGYLGQSTSPTGIQMASPYLQGASGNVADVNAYFNPYTDAVVDRIAELGTRNLSDNIMPALEGRYITSGQFRGSGQLTDTMRAVRDTSNDILGQQSAALQSGYNAAQQAKLADLNRYAGLASTAGNLGMGQQNILANAGNALTGMGTAAGNLTAGQQQLLANIGTQRGQFTQGQQQLATGIGNSLGNLAQADQSGALSAANALAALGGQRAGITQNQQQLASNIGTNLGQFAQGQQATNLNAAGALAGLGTSGASLAQGQQNFYSGLGNSAGALAGADASRGLSAAQQLASLGGLAQSYGLTGAGALGQIGNQQQQLSQQNLNVAYEDFLRQQGYPQSQIDAMLGTFKGIATGVPSATQQAGIVPSGQQQQYQPSTASTIASGLLGLGGLLSGIKGL